jgi:hypothetical protein
MFAGYEFCLPRCVWRSHSCARSAGANANNAAGGAKKPIDTGRTGGVKAAFLNKTDEPVRWNVVGVM